MIASSRLAKSVAAVSACLLHGVAVWALTDRVEIEMAGSAGAAEARLGSSFADMAAGSLSAETTEDVTETETPEAESQPSEAEDMAEPIEPEPAEKDTPDPAERDAPQDVVKTVAPQDRTARPRPETTARTADPSQEAPKPEVNATATVPAAERATLAASPSQTTAAADTAETAESVTPTTPEPVTPTETVKAEPPTPETPEAPDPAEVVAAEDETQTAVTRSLRPRTRSRDFEERHKPEPQVTRAARQEKSRQPKAQPRGNADRTAAAGSATGREQATAARQGTGATTAESGNAAASNYPGQVMRRLSRVPRPRVGARGAAVIAFTIAPGGGLSAVSLARSSGSGALDRAALRVVRSAAPFPPPPPGARRNFSIRIKGG